MILHRNVRGPVHRAGVRIALTLFLVGLGFCGIGVAQAEPPSVSAVDGGAGTQSGSGASNAAPQTAQAKGSIAGTVTVPGGGVAVGAQVRLTRAGQAPVDILSNDDGQYSFATQPPGPFQLTISATGFETKVYSGSLGTGAVFIVPGIELDVARATTEVKVSATVEEVAQEQIEYQEKQRVLGFIPNFYASYVPDAAPLNPRQKFELAWKSVTDPMTIVGAGALAGIYQAADEYGGYGQGAEGYFKRFGATYGGVFIGTFIDSAILTSVLKQDPRYFYRGTGSKKSRLMYALGNAVMCKGDNKTYQVNYSTIVGSFITSGITFAYTPASDRSTSLYFQSTLIRIAEGGVAGLFQEFVVKKLTPHLKKDPPQP